MVSTKDAQINANILSKKMFIINIAVCMDTGCAPLCDYFIYTFKGG